MPLPEKYSRNRMTFRGFINQCKLIFQLQPQQYSTDSRRVGLILTLLSGEALNWASPLIEQQSPLLSDFNGFLVAMAVIFDDPNHEGLDRYNQGRACKS
uniref:EEF1A lysine methyltransferase 3 n=1 Tax=Xenopus tropicalis TaxID=8364 RepID=A0A5S6LHU2_XENTR